MSRLLLALWVAALWPVACPSRLPHPAPPPEAVALLKAAEDLVADEDFFASGKLAMKWLGSSFGCGVVAKEPIVRGETLLSGPLTPRGVVGAPFRASWESEGFHALSGVFTDWPGAAPGSTVLTLKLANLLLHIDRSDPSTLGPLERYISAVPWATQALAWWPDEARALLQGSALLAQVPSTVALQYHMAAAIHGRWPRDLLPKPSSKQVLGAVARATAIQATRAFATEGFGALLIPLLDMPNHAPASASNAAITSSSRERWQMVAAADIAAGEEISICYMDADYLSVWGMYGFFDQAALGDAIAHIEVSPGLLAEGHPGGIYAVPGTELVEELKELVPASLGPEAARRHVQSRLAELIRAHLAGYPPLSVAGAEDALEEYRRTARHVVDVERGLLRGTLEKLEADLNAPPQS